MAFMSFARRRFIAILVISKKPQRSYRGGYPPS
jgi:hypothetical protein